jgi:hypothetical protein
MLGALSAAMFIVAGCGSTHGYANANRPPAPLNVAVNLTDQRISISPARIGAGPVVLLIANESTASHDLTLTPPSGSNNSCVASEASSGPINPQGVARVQVNVVEGDCVLGVEDGGLPPTRLKVGPERTSSQDDLLQP